MPLQTPELLGEGYATRGDLVTLKEEIITGLQTGQILLPQVIPDQPIYAGGTNHCPNSDLSYSLMAATIPGTLPGTPGDTNHEAYRFYRQDKNALVTIDPAHALKALAHSAFAANEGANLDIPAWERLDGWIEMGAVGTQYDIAVQLLAKLVSPGQRWYARFKIVALKPDLVPADVQIYAGVWHKYSISGTPGEGWVQGDPFKLEYLVVGRAAAHALEYRVLAKTDSGVSLLSQILSVPNAPAVLSPTEYVKIFYNAGPGFIEFQVFKHEAGAFSQIATIRNSTDLQHNDIGYAGVPVSGWPADPGSAPRAFAQSANVRIAPFGATWGSNDLTIDIPKTYDFSKTLQDGQFLRFGLTAPTAVGRHIGIDRIWFSTTFNVWAPDVIRLSDGTAPIPSIAPTEGNQGGGGPVITPPPGGSGGHTCVRTTMPVLMRSGRRAVFKRFSDTGVGDKIIGESRLPYQVLRKKLGTSSEYLIFRTANGIRYECNKEHRFVMDVERRRYQKADNLKVGDEIPSWVRGRIRLTTIIDKKLIPRECEVGTYVLRDLSGIHGDGNGIYVAGYSDTKDRGLLASNAKPIDADYLA